jgi:CDP-4-dehydro-6-deoxyglucose reductase, E1
MGEGGAIATNNLKLSEIIESYINWGRDCFCAPGQSNTCGKRFGYTWDKLPDGWDHKYTFTRVGYNLKITELQAALGVSQLKRVEDVVNKRRRNFFFLSSTIQDYDTNGFFIFPKYHFWNISPFGCPILINQSAPFTADEFIFYLEERDIRTRRVFAGNITKQPAFQNLPYISVDFEGSDYVMNNMLWVGCQDALTGEQMLYVKDKIIDFMERYT